MAKNQVPLSDDRGAQVAGQAAWKIWVCVEIVGVFIGAAWVYASAVFRPYLASSPWQISTLFAVQALLALVLERLLALHPLKLAWRYRLTFLAAAGSLIAAPLVWALAGRWPPAGWPVVATALLAGLAGGFAGSLLASGLNEGLWEDNAPPAGRVQEEVQRRHQRIIGKPAAGPFGRRLFDLFLALTVALLSMPVWVVASFLIWFEDPGPIFFVKNSVGRGGVNFRQFKFRTMVRGAELRTGPVLASEADPRILFSGWFLRKTALDELPQLLNILRGEMSFVGPRPQRTVLVYSYLQKMPEYAWRHTVRPGLAGLAQVAGDYYLTPRQKLRFDRLYIRYSGLGFDLKLLFLACLITFWYRWQKGWNGRLPRQLLHRR